MRVLYDGVIYRIQRYGGVVRYFNGLIHHLPPSVHPILLAPNQPAVAPDNPNLSIFIETCETLLWPIKPLRKSIIAHRSFRRIEAEQPDVIHPTYYYSSLRHLNQKVNTPTVLTVYDLIHEKFPSEMDPAGKQRRLKRQAVERADAIICISESTKTDLQHFYQLPDERIRVIYPGCGFEPENPGVSAIQLAAKKLASKSGENSTEEKNNNSFGLPGKGDGPRYLLYVGERGFYKNFDRTIQALAKVVQSQPDLQLLCIGGKPFSRTEKRKISRLGLENHLSRQASLNDQQMREVYSQALAVIYPSLYEGFGIPIIEGMACGTAVLTSNSASMPEVAGGAAMLFDPYSVDQIAEAMHAVATDENQRKDLIARGIQRAQDFSFAKCAAETVEVYQSVSRRSEVAA